MSSIDMSLLPLEVRAKLAELDIEISEGDITQKGYDKKRAKLLEPFHNILKAPPDEVRSKKAVRSTDRPPPASNGQTGGSKRVPAKSIIQRQRHSRRDDRYRSDAHSEAVQVALAKHKAKRVPVLPLPVKRRSLMFHGTQNSVGDSTDDEAVTDISTGDDDGSLRRVTDDTSSTRSTDSVTPSPVVSRLRISHQHSVDGNNAHRRSSSPYRSSPVSSNERSGKRHHRSHQQPQHHSCNTQPTPLTQKLADIMPQILPGSRPLSQTLPPDVANIPRTSATTTGTTTPSTALMTSSSAELNNTAESKSSRSASLLSGNEADGDESIAVTKVSAKIQQLLLTLKRPKKKPLAEYFQDDQEELLESSTVDDDAPKPEGTVTSAREGGAMPPQTNTPHSIEAAIHRFGTANPKAPCLTQVDLYGKLAYTLTYGKLLSRMKKVAYTLLHKKHGLQSGHRVALVYPNSEPAVFVSSFYGCLLAGLVPVVVEVPMSSEDPGSSRLGFLLGSCGVNTALTSEHCLKALPKNDKGEVLQLKGWPRLQWIVTNTRHLQKPGSGWEPPAPSSADQLAYIEYKTGKEGSVVGVAHTRAIVHRHCRALVGALSYNSGDIAVNLLDFKKGFGLTHGVMASVFSGMHVFCVPYALMKQNPLQWLNIIAKHKASLALVKSRDLHWTLSATRDVGQGVSLKTVRMMLVSDGANPWSIGACDMFIAEYEKRGLGRDCICPCAWSSEALTVAIRRPGSEACRTALSLHDMSYDIIHEETPASQDPAVVLQDCGNILPGSTIAVVRLDDSKDPHLCRSDQIGELVVSVTPIADDRVGGGGSWYYGLKGMSEKQFSAHPVDESDHDRRDDNAFVRTGLAGYVTPNGRVMVTGKVDGMIRVSARNHNADDLVATVLAIDSVRIVHRGRIAVFSVPVLRDERLVVIIEQKLDTTEEQCFKWMSSVIQAIEGIHNVGVYCLSLLSPNGLPRTPLGGVHLSETRARFLDGNLCPRNILMSPHQCVLNLPKPRQKHNDVGAASILQGQVVTGVRLAEAKGRHLGAICDDHDDHAGGDGKQRKNFQYLAEILKWRAHNTPDHVLFSQIGGKGTATCTMSCAQLHKKAEKIAQALLSPPASSSYTISTGDHVALLFQPGVELVQAFYGCLYAGCVPVPIRPPNQRTLAATLSTVKMIMEISRVVITLSSAPVLRVLRSREAQAIVPLSSLPAIVDVDDAPRKKAKMTQYVPPTPEMLAYVDFSITTAGTLAGIKMSHYASSQLCRSMKLQCELYPSRAVALCLDPYSGLGLALWCLSSVYSGHHTLLLSPTELETNPQLWLQTISNFKVRDAFLSYSVIELCTKGLASHIPALKTRGVTLSHVRTCVIVAEERPRVQLTSNFTKLFRDLGLSQRAVSTAFGCRVNVAVCLQGASCPDPTTVYVDMRALRNDRISLVEKGSPHSLCLMETGKILPGTKVVIADPDTMGQCSDSRLGEVWVSSPHTAHGYSAVFDGTGDHLEECQDHFQAQLRTGDTQTKYARTGFLGFLRRTELTSATGERHDALYIVGSLEDTLELRGMRYHPIDIENSVVRCTSKIAECAVFHSTNLLVVVVELEGAESHALDLVPMVTSVILEEHYLIPGVVAVVDPGSIPVNSRGEKQRMHLKDSFLQDQLDPIYVAYNM